MDQVEPLISLEQAQQLVAALESGDVVDANRQVEKVLREQDDLIYQQIGVLTRELHDAFTQITHDLGSSGVTGQEVTDIRTSLRHVAEMMERAANDSLAAVEVSVSLAKEIASSADNVAEGLEQLRNREQDQKQLLEFSKKMEEFVSISVSNSDMIHHRLNEVMMAQSFQDLSGQIIHRVVDVIGKVEDSLVELLRLSGSEDREREDREVHGPAVPDTGTQDDVVGGQDEVDDLLSSLGF